MIRLRDVKKSYPGTAAPAVDGVSLDVPEGQTVALIGPSGCGKSTLLRLILGLIEPTGGTVDFEGVDEPTARRRACGYVIQDGGLFPHLTARGNVALLPKSLGWDHQRIDERLGTLCDLTDFPRDGLDRYPTELSGGQRQRVALMRALMIDPPVLLLDEPLGALDPLIRFDLQRDLRDIFRELGKTTVMVTHDLAEAAYFADTIVLMRGGRVVQAADYETLKNAPADGFVESFLAAQRTLHVA